MCLIVIDVLPQTLSIPSFLPPSCRRLQAAALYRLCRGRGEEGAQFVQERHVPSNLSLMLRHCVCPRPLCLDARSSSKEETFHSSSDWRKKEKLGTLVFVSFLANHKKGHSPSLE